jgi:hypothetical protein
MQALLSVPVLALSLLAGTHAPPFSLTLSPVNQAIAVGQVRDVHVYDTGTDPLTLTATEHEIIRVHGQCRASLAPVPYVLLSKTSLHLKPKGEVTVRVHVIKGAKPGQHSLETVIAVPTGQRAGVRIAGAAASTMLLAVPGRVSPHAPKPCVTLAQPASHTALSFLVVTVLAGVGGLLALLLAGWAVALRRRHHRPAIAGRHRS